MSSSSSSTLGDEGFILSSCEVFPLFLATQWLVELGDDSAPLSPPAFGEGGEGSETEELVLCFAGLQKGRFVVAALAQLS